MHKSEKRWLILAAILTVLGGILFAGAMTAAQWDTSKLSTETYETNTHAVGDTFDSIRIETGTADTVFLPSADGKCSVVYYENTKVKHTVGVTDGTLSIRAVDTRAWFDRFGILTETPKITVYLPEAAYASLNVSSSTGDVEISHGFTFDAMHLEASTGDVSAAGILAGSISVSVSTGHVTLSDITCAGELSLRCSTGGVEISDTVCGSLRSEGSTGRITMRNVITNGTVSVERSTGDICFDRCDAAAIRIRTDTGDVTGSLLTDKLFFTETDMGKVEVPKTADGGICEIVTDTGDIRITVE